MKNKEKYLNEILEAFILEKKCGFIKDYVLKAPSCNDLECDKCTIKMQKWLEAEYQEPIKLTDDEIVILKNIDKKYKWIAENYDWSACGKDRRLTLYIEKPIKGETVWLQLSRFDVDNNRYDFYVYNHLFNFIKWEDEEPYSIEKLLKQNGVER